MSTLRPSRSFLEALPKAELHVHLEGSIGPELALTLAERRGVELPGADGGVEGLRAQYRFTDFRAFLQLYVAVSSCLERAEDFELVVVEVARSLAAQNVRYAETTFTPMTHVTRGVDAAAMLDGLARGRARALEEHSVDIAWVFDVVRSFPDQADPTLDLAVQAGAVGFGVGGPEGPRWSGEPLARTFARAKAEGLRSVPHAGEQDGPRSIREALDRFGAERIGHGVRCLEDPELVAELVARQIPLEVCPSSNVALGVAASWEEHPLPRLIAAGLAVSLASDDPPMFGTTLVDEYVRAVETFGWDHGRVRDIAAAGVRHSCLSEARKEELLKAQRAIPSG